MCVERGWMPEDGTDEDLVVALHALVAASPSVLVGVALTDAVGDRRAQNQPGTDKEYPNWRVPLTDAAGQAVLIEDLPTLPLLRRLVDAVRCRGRGVRERCRIGAGTPIKRRAPGTSATARPRRDPR